MNAVLTGRTEIQNHASSGRAAWLSLSAIFLAALILRITFVLLKTYIIAPGDGREMRNIAKSLASSGPPATGAAHAVAPVAEHMHFPIESFMVILACYGAIRAAGLLEKREDVPQTRGMVA